MIAKFGFKRSKSRPEIDMAAHPNGQFRAQSSAHVETSSASATNLISPRARKLVKSLDHGKQVTSVSNTMKMALASASASSSTPVLTTSTRPEILHSNSTPNPFVRHAPRSRAEQYWAARALTAETLLVARKEHYEDVRSVTFVAETKRGVRSLFYSNLQHSHRISTERSREIEPNIRYETGEVGKTFSA